MKILQLLVVACDRSSLHKAVKLPRQASATAGAFRLQTGAAETYPEARISFPSDSWCLLLGEDLPLVGSSMLQSGLIENCEDLACSVAHR